MSRCGYTGGKNVPDEGRPMLAISMKSHPLRVTLEPRLGMLMPNDFKPYLGDSSEETHPVDVHWLQLGH